MFVPGGAPVRTTASSRRSRVRLAAEADRYGVALGEPRQRRRRVGRKGRDVPLAERPAVASFAFGCPPRESDRRPARSAGIEVWVTVTTPAEARSARPIAGADALVVQGAEAGGHRGGFADSDVRLRAVRAARAARVWCRAASPAADGGGGRDRRRRRRSPPCSPPGAARGAARHGVPAPRHEAGTHPRTSAALASDGDDRADAARSRGRRARGIVNRFLARPQCRRAGRPTPRCTT